MEDIELLDRKINSLEGSVERMNERISETKVQLEQVKASRLGISSSKVTLENVALEINKKELDIPRLIHDEGYRIEVALKLFNGNKRKTSKYLGMSERTLFRKIKKYNVS